jgi:hypothetical protein
MSRAHSLHFAQNRQSFLCAAVTAMALVLALLAAGTPRAEAGSPLNADLLQAGLRTADPDEQAYLIYIATLLEQGRLPRDLVESTFQWARRKPNPKKAQYFKLAMITRAAELGITLPEGTPALTGSIRGQVFTRVLLIDVPNPRITVVIDGTKFETLTDGRGAFSFDNVPFGRYTVRAKGVTAMMLRHAAADVILPTTPPSTQPATVILELR